MDTSNRPISVVYFGSNDFSAKVLSNILLDKDISIKYIVTKKDKDIGRGRVNTLNSVAKIAQSASIPVLQVSSLVKNPSQLSTIDFNKIDLCVVVSFAYLLPYDILSQVKKGFVNLHPSLLPKYRGPAPIHYSIINGDVDLGISIMLLDEGMDTGPVLSQQHITIKSNQIYPEVAEILIDKGSKLLLDTVKDYINNRILPHSQDSKGAIVTSFIKKEDGFVTLDENPIHIYNKWRAFYTWPGIYTTVEKFEKFSGLTLRVKDKSTIIKLKDILLDETQKLQILKLQLPNKPVITYKDFVNGYL